MPVEHQGTARPRGQYDTCLGRHVCSACTLLHCSPPSLHARRVSAEAYGAPYMYQVPTGTHLHVNTNTDRSQAKFGSCNSPFHSPFQQRPEPLATNTTVIGLLMVCTRRATAPSPPRSPPARLQRPLGPRCTERSPPGAEGLFGPEDLRDRWQRTNIAVKYCPFRFSCTQQGARGVEKHIWVEVSFLLSAACPPPPLRCHPHLPSPLGAHVARCAVGHPVSFSNAQTVTTENRRALVVRRSSACQLAATLRPTAKRPNAPLVAPFAARGARMHSRRRRSARDWPRRVGDYPRQRRRWSQCLPHRLGSWHSV